MSKERFVCRIRICGEIYTPTAEPIDNSTRQLHVNFRYISFNVVKCTVCSWNTARFMLKLNYKHWLYKLFCSTKINLKNRTAHFFVKAIRLDEQNNLYSQSYIDIFRCLFICFFPGRFEQQKINCPYFLKELQQLNISSVKYIQSSERFVSCIFSKLPWKST